MKKTLTIISILISLVILCSLGTWQLKRLAWKESIITQLQTEYAKDPLQNQLNLKDFETDRSLRYGSAKGRFQYGKEILVGPIPHESKIGYRVLTPMKLQTGGYLLVNRGWIEDGKQGQLQATRPSGNITVTGIFRQPDWNKFTPENSPENDVWTKLDIDEIADVKNINPVAPVILYAESASKDLGAPIMQAEKWYPRNKHKQYAIFWFTMAFVLLGVCGFYMRQSKKS